MQSHPADAIYRPADAEFTGPERLDRLIRNLLRALRTCRRPLAALAGACHRVLLGPLPSGEAALYLREHHGLREMVFGGDPGEKELAMRLLAASRFHPLLMDRLARLATGGHCTRPRQ